MKVVHCKKEPFDVYIGRPSKWGNPFTIGKDGTREEVIEKYRDWIIEQDDLMEALPELKGKVLGCWCSPKSCHGDVLIELAKKICPMCGGDLIQEWHDENNYQFVCKEKCGYYE